MSPSLHRCRAGYSLQQRLRPSGSASRDGSGRAQACAKRLAVDGEAGCAEASSPSFTIGEKELRSSVDSISLAMPSSLLRDHFDGDRIELGVGDVLAHRLAPVPVEDEVAVPGRPRPHQPGLTSVVVSDCSTIAGPSKVKPAGHRRAVVDRGLDERPDCRRSGSRRVAVVALLPWRESAAVDPVEPAGAGGRCEG